MLPVSLSLNNRKVLIIGGGKVALRKAKLFLEQKAVLTIMSACTLNEFNELDVTVISKDYDDEDLSSYFLVYAATDNKEVNNKIVERCHERSILCGSATYGQKASFYSMGYRENDLGMVAVSMNQKLPYHRPILEDMMCVFEEHRDKIELLCEIRDYVVKHCENKKEVMKELFDVPYDILSFIYKGIKENKGYVFVYHHSEYTQSFDFKVEPSLYLDLKAYEYFIDLLKQFSFIKIVPLLLSKGKIYENIEKLKGELECVSPLIENYDELNKITELFQSDKEVKFIVHPREKKKINDNRFYELDDDLCLLKEHEYHIVLLLMVKGQHYHDIIEKLENYKAKGYLISYECLLDNQNIVKIIEDKVKEETYA